MFDLAYFEYDRLVRRYLDLFGPDRVPILPFELMRQDPDAFAARIGEFSGAGPARSITRDRVNPALSGLSVLAKRPVNFLLVRDRVNPAGLVGSPRSAAAIERFFDASDRLVPGSARRAPDAHARKRISEHVAGRFGPSNARLAELTGLDLRSYGYEIA